jgi:hypothetical protein
VNLWEARTESASLQLPSLSTWVEAPAP